MAASTKPRNKAGVAHEDAGRVKVVHQKAKTSPQQGGRQSADQVLAVHDGQQQEKDRSHGADASRQTVHVVQQVHGVGDDDHPDKGHGDIQYLPGEGADVDAGHDQERGGQELADQLEPRAQAAAVVPQAEERHQAGADQDADQLVQAEAVAEQQQGGDEGGIDGQSAHQWNGLDVDFAGAGLVGDPKPQRQVPHERRPTHGHNQGAGKDEHVGCHVGSLWTHSTLLRGLALGRRAYFSAIRMVRILSETAICEATSSPSVT